MNFASGSRSRPWRVYLESKASFGRCHGDGICCVGVSILGFGFGQSLPEQQLGAGMNPIRIASRCRALYVRLHVLFGQYRTGCTTRSSVKWLYFSWWISQLGLFEVAEYPNEHETSLNQRPASKLKILAFGNNLATVLDPVQINHAFQMIDFMLKDPRDKSFQPGFY